MFTKLKLLITTSNNIFYSFIAAKNSYRMVVVALWKKYDFIDESFVLSNGVIVINVSAVVSVEKIK